MTPYREGAFTQHEHRYLLLAAELDCALFSVLSWITPKRLEKTGIRVRLVLSGFRYTTDRRMSRLICLKISWTDYAAFELGFSQVAHIHPESPYG